MSLKSNYSYLSYFILALFIAVILFFPSVVSAATLTPRSAIDNFSSNNKFDYTGIASSDERPQENWTFTGIVGTTFSRQLFGVKAAFNYSIIKNHTYKITISNSSNNFYSTSLQYYSPQFCFGSSYVGATSNCVSGNLQAVNSNSVSYIFRSNVNSSYFRFSYGPITDKNYYLTSSYSFNLSSFTIEDLNATPSSPTNQDVINNDNQNTTNIIDEINDLNGQLAVWGQDNLNATNEAKQDIIDNQNNNTDNIIYNQNKNTDKIDRDLVNCQERTVKMEPRQSGAYIAGSNGRINNNSAYMVSKFYRVNNSQNITIHFKNIEGMGYGYLCNYNQDMQLMGSCIRYMDMSSYSAEPFTYSPSGTYITFTYKRDSGAEFTGNICSSSAETSQDIYNYISDGNIDGNIGSSFFDNFNNNMHGLSGIITIPLSSIQSLSSSQCTPLHFPIPFTDNKYLDVPCMTEIYQQHVPTLLTLIQTCWYGILAYHVLVNIFAIVKGFKDPDSDKIEVMDL